MVGNQKVLKLEEYGTIIVTTVINRVNKSVALPKALYVQKISYIQVSIS